MIKPLIYFLVLTNSYLLSTSQQEDQSKCSKSACNPGEPDIRFPFRVKDRQSSLCGYPGFDLSCGQPGQTLLKLPNSDQYFSVKAIDYATQEIWINDPEKCLPKKIMTSLNLSGSPFHSEFELGFSFFKCSPDFVFKSGLNPISCMSTETRVVFATSSPRVSRFLAARCEGLGRFSVPVDWSFYTEVSSSDLSDHLRLAWDVPTCGKCVARGGTCGFRANSTRRIVCSNIPSRRGT